MNRRIVGIGLAVIALAAGAYLTLSPSLPKAKPTTKPTSQPVAVTAKAAPTATMVVVAAVKSQPVSVQIAEEQARRLFSSFRTAKFDACIPVYWHFPLEGKILVGYIDQKDLARPGLVFADFSGQKLPNGKKFPNGLTAVGENKLAMTEYSPLICVENKYVSK